jgi:hypothetical protein
MKILKIVEVHEVEVADDFSITDDFKSEVLTTFLTTSRHELATYLHSVGCYTSAEPTEMILEEKHTL